MKEGLAQAMLPSLAGPGVSVQGPVLGLPFPLYLGCSGSGSRDVCRPKGCQRNSSPHGQLLSGLPSSSSLTALALLSRFAQWLSLLPVRWEVHSRAWGQGASKIPDPHR